MKQDDPCEHCLAGACGDCCANCSVRYPDGKKSKLAGQVTIYGIRDEFGGL